MTNLPTGQTLFDRFDLALQRVAHSGAVVDLDHHADPGGGLGNGHDTRLDQGHDLVPIALHIGEQGIGLVGESALAYQANGVGDGLADAGTDPERRNGEGSDHAQIFAPHGLPARLALMEDQPEPVESISAVTLLTANMVEAVAFYQVLGFRLLYGGPESAFTSFRVGAGYVNLQLDPAESSPRRIWGRVVFWVDDVDAMFRRVLAAGFDAETSPADAPWGERYFHIHDPDGHELSFARPLAPS